MPKFKIETALTVTLLRTWDVEAVNADDARKKWENGEVEDMVSEITNRVVGDETLEGVSQWEND